MQPQPSGSKSVLQALREGKSIAPAESIDAKLSSFFDQAPSGALVELEPSNQTNDPLNQTNGVPAARSSQKNEPKPDRHMMHAEDFEERMLAAAKPDNQHHAPANSGGKHGKGAIVVPESFTGVNMPQMPGNAKSVEEKSRPKIQVTAPTPPAEVAAKEPAWGGSSKAPAQPVSMLQIQETQQMVEQERQDALQKQQQQSGLPAGGWQSKVQSSGPRLQDIMAAEEKVAASKAAPAPAPVASAPAADDGSMFWSYNDSPSVGPSRSSIKPEPGKRDDISASNGEDFPALGASQPRQRAPQRAPAVQVPTVPAPPKPVVAPPTQSKPTPWLNQSHFPSLGGNPKPNTKAPAVTSNNGHSGNGTWKQAPQPHSESFKMQELEKWCKSELQKFNHTDITFVYLLCSLTNPDDVRAQIRKQLGSSQSASKFAADFLHMHGACMNGSQVSSAQPSSEPKEPQASTNKGKKKKKGGRSKVDPNLLGFGVSASGRLLENDRTL